MRAYEQASQHLWLRIKNNETSRIKLTSRSQFEFLLCAKNRHSRFGLIILGGCPLGRKRGIFVLASDEILDDDGTTLFLVFDCS
jgi:hypothetical protein